MNRSRFCGAALILASSFTHFSATCEDAPSFNLEIIEQLRSEEIAINGTAKQKYSCDSLDQATDQNVVLENEELIASYLNCVEQVNQQYLITYGGLGSLALSSAAAAVLFPPASLAALSVGVVAIGGLFKNLIDGKSDNHISLDNIGREIKDRGFEIDIKSIQ